jgi:hypothetical protein
VSGGSYGYLYSKDAGDLMSYACHSELQAMAERIAGLGYAEDAAKDAFDLIAMLTTQRVRIDAAIDRLSDVFRAVEWWDSSDWSENAVRSALAKYRGEEPA